MMENIGLDFMWKAKANIYVCNLLFIHFRNFNRIFLDDEVSFKF